MRACMLSALQDSRCNVAWFCIGMVISVFFGGMAALEREAFLSPCREQVWMVHMRVHGAVLVHGLERAVLLLRGKCGDGHSLPFF